MVGTRLLLYSWNANNEQILADNLIKQGFEISWFRKKCKHYTRDMELAMEMIQCIHEVGADSVISFNYFPIISMICNTVQIPYYAWVYDCPHFTLYAKQITLPCNHIAIFDKGMVKRLEEYGVTTVFHVPLSVDTEYFSRTIQAASDKEKKKYQCDISFVGSLYTDEHNYYDLLFNEEHTGEHFDESDRADGMSVMDAVIKRQLFSYEKDYIRQAVAAGEIDLETLHSKMKEQGLMLGEDYFASPEDILLAAVLEKKVTVEERRILLTEIVKRFAFSGDETDCGKKSADRQDCTMMSQDKCLVAVYTASNTEKLGLLHSCNHGVVDYHTQMPLVFAGSKINLNISLRSIHSGIPLRVLDIMACGGFVLTNWQPEVVEYFEDGAEVVTFNSLEDCMEKVSYYLAQEEERCQIAAAGQKKVREVFSYQVGLDKILA